MLTEEDKVRARHHLGYAGVAESSTFFLGVPAGIQTQYVAEGAFNRVLPQSEDKLRALLDKMDACEQQIEENTELLVVTKVDEIDIRQDEMEQLIKRYRYWQASLGNLLAIPPNPFDQRFSGWGAGAGGVNVAVSH